MRSCTPKFDQYGDPQSSCLRTKKMKEQKKRRRNTRTRQRRRRRRNWRGHAYKPCMSFTSEVKLSCRQRANNARADCNTKRCVKHSHSRFCQRKRQGLMRSKWHAGKSGTQTKKNTRMHTHRKTPPPRHAHLHIHTNIKCKRIHSKAN